MTVEAYSDDLREYYFSAEPGRSSILTMEIRHPAIVDEDNNPYVPRVANWPEDIEATLEADAPANGGETVTFLACRFDFVPPDNPDSGLPKASITIDNVTSLLTPWLQAATYSPDPVAVTFREYLADDLSAPDAIVNGLTLETADAALTSVTADLGYEDTLNAAFPDQIYRSDVYRGLVR